MFGKFSEFKYNKLIALYESYIPTDEYDPYIAQAIDDYVSREGSIEADKWCYKLTPANRLKEFKKLAIAKEQNDTNAIIDHVSKMSQAIYRLEWCQKNWPEAVEMIKSCVYDKVFKEKHDKIFSDSLYYRDIAKKDEDTKRQFEDDIQNTDTSKYAPTDRDWEKMIDYMVKKSDPNRLAYSCKDQRKIIARYIIANCLGWRDAADAFKEHAIYDANIPESVIEAYYRKYVNNGIPEKWKDYIDAQKEDQKSGLNIIGSNNEKIFKVVQSVLDNANNIENYELCDIQPINNRKQQLIKLTTINGNESYLYYAFGNFKDTYSFGIKHSAIFTGFNELPTQNDCLNIYTSKTIWCRTQKTFRVELEFYIQHLN